ncbi:hypothetical protein [Megasphaera sp.]
MRRKWEARDKIKMAKKAGSLAGGLAVGASYGLFRSIPLKKPMKTIKVA